MSLSWNIEDCPNRQAIEDMDDVVREAIILGTIFTGIGRLSGDDVAEFYARYTLIDKLLGPFIRDGEGKPRRITIEEVQTCTGLWTNVTKESRAAWIKRQIGPTLDEFVGQVRQHDIKRLAEATKEGE